MFTNEFYDARPAAGSEALHHHLVRPPVGTAGRRGAARFLVVLAVPEEAGPRLPHHRLVLAALADELSEVLAGGIDRDGATAPRVWVEEDRRRVVALVDAGTPRELRRSLDRLCAAASSVPLALPDGTSTLVDVGAGWMPVPARATTDEVGVRLRLATAAARRGLVNRDHVGVRAVDDEAPRAALFPAGLRLALQVLAGTVASVAVPFLLLLLAHGQGYDLAAAAYVVVVLALGVTAVLIWTESLHALSPPALPEASPAAAPPATAVIAAYLPNEADTIIESVRHLLGQDYPDLQVILAYNTPETLPVEAELARLARLHPRLELLRVENSTSKAQNVNAALDLARGEFIGIFDADHHPMAGAFTRAWRWIGDGADVVQGHCVVRNGDESRVSRTVAVEFEQIYAVSHPGRASMHGFGVFGGSNGYWRTSVLRRLRMRVDRLTEDIDVSVRAVLDGHRIVNDPGLISRELAPTTVTALWRQRVRWAQGWFQVSLTLLGTGLRRSGLTIRQRAGLLALLGWREVYPWISPVMLAVLAFIWWRDGELSWSSPLFLLTTLYTVASGPAQVLVAWRLAAPEIRERRAWFWGYLFVSAIFYTEAKNVVARVAQLKQLTGEHEWVVTPRGRTSASAAFTTDDLEVVA